MIKVPRRKIMTLQQAVEEANRCLLCAEPPCNTDCAAGTEPAKFIRQLKFGNIKGAIRTIRRNNILGGTCAFVCPTCRLCEKGCSRSGLDVPIRISEIQAFLIDYERNLGMETLLAPKPGDKKIAVIGAGPAGLSASAYLALAGYQVTVFEKGDQPGGVLRYGIPVFRLPREILDFECDIIRRLGVKFKYHHKITGERALDKLLNSGFDAIFLATGWDQPYTLGLKGEEADGVFLWDKFLRLMNEPHQRRILARKLNQKNVVVVGGGSVAMDCAVWAKYAGARRVYAISLEGLDELPADKEEKELAFAEKVIFKPNSRITEIVVRGGKVKGVKGVEIRWRKPGWLVPENAEDIPGTDFSLICDFVIEAIGTGLSSESIRLFADLKRKGKCLIVNEKTYRTSRARIYAGGDLTHIGGTVAMAVKDGKSAAQAIIQEVPLKKSTVKPRYVSKPTLAVTFCGVKFNNPFLLSSSPCLLYTSPSP
ncbi:MAG: FAD-dependent oxidoreductase, partial [Candidatus Sumerlaeia bacterium]|nr:FAD-dependent oxidoreductase [Candidatus Sumerlaeia bacterium]